MANFTQLGSNAYIGQPVVCDLEEVAKDSQLHNSLKAKVAIFTILEKSADLVYKVRDASGKIISLTEEESHCVFDANEWWSSMISSIEGATISCHKCSTSNTISANYCNNCGISLKSILKEEMKKGSHPQNLNSFDTIKEPEKSIDIQDSDILYVLERLERAIFEPEANSERTAIVAKIKGLKLTPLKRIDEVLRISKPEAFLRIQLNGFCPEKSNFTLNGDPNNLPDNIDTVLIDWAARKVNFKLKDFKEEWIQESKARLYLTPYEELIEE